MDLPATSPVVGSHPSAEADGLSRLFDAASIASHVTPPPTAGFRRRLRPYGLPTFHSPIASTMSEEKKIIIDEDWKSQVEAEKAAASSTDDEPQPSKSDQPSPPADPVASMADSLPEAGDPPSDSSAVGEERPVDPPMPPASFSMLMSSLATEAMISMGHMPHPATGQMVKQRNQAKYLIDMLEVLQGKTTGNLTTEETVALSDVLHQLRMAFVATK